MGGIRTRVRGDMTVYGNVAQANANPSGKSAQVYTETGGNPTRSLIGKIRLWWIVYYPTLCFWKQPTMMKLPIPTTVILKVAMHCEACAQCLQKRIRKIQGVNSVEIDVASNKVVVKGVIDPIKLVDDVYKRTRKQASIVEEKKGKKRRIRRVI